MGLRAMNVREISDDLKVRWWDSISVRLGLGALIIILGALALTLLIVATQEEQHFTEEHLNAARISAALTAADLGEQMIAGGGAAVWSAISARTVQRGQMTGASRILVLSKDGVVKAGSESNAIGTRIETRANPECPACDSVRLEDFPASKVLTSPEGYRLLRVVTVIPAIQACKACHTREEKVRGYITSDFDISRLDNSAKERRRSVLLVGLISGIAMLVLISLLFRRLVMRPLGALVRSFKRFASGNLGERTQVLGRNELALLAGDFNNMAERIEDQVARIETANTALELLYTLVVEASRSLEISEFAMAVYRVVSGKFHSTHTLFFLDAADSGWICATAGKQQGETLERGDDTLETALASGSAQLQQLLDTVPLQFVMDACRLQKLQFMGAGRRTFVLPVIADTRLVGLLVCIGISEKTRLDEDTLNNLGAHLTLAAANSRNYTRAITDGLTRLRNKQYGLFRLEDAVFAARRYGSGLALAMCDIDFFKRVNDTYGHPAGDAVLREVCHRIAGCVRKADTAVRYGGEEFMLILPEADANSLSTIGENIRQAVADSPISLGIAGGSLPITMSIGIAAFHAADDSGESLIARADQALYRAKKNGRNRVELDP
jgi:diguanylate cyclase (GGDEF)-like protein